MSPRIALHDFVFRAYVFTALGLLILAAIAIPALGRMRGRDVSGVWRTYYGWLLMIPLITLAVFLGRAATDIGVALLGVVAFKEFARATGLYRDWWMTGAVYTLIAIGATLTLVPRDPDVAFRWYLTMPAFAVVALLLVPILRDRPAGELQPFSL